jgi:hypothetical protein
MVDGRLVAPLPEEKHGLGGYSNHGCRCETCCEANLAYSRAYQLYVTKLGKRMA